MEPIIKSLLDVDLYKLTMMMAVLKKFPYAKVRYSFINRGKTKFPEGLRNQIKYTENLSLTKDEKSWMKKNCYYFEPWFLDFLQGYRYNSAEVGIIQKGNNLDVTGDGYWYRTILWETTLMSIISELFYKMTKQEPIKLEERKKKNAEKMKLFEMNNIHYADFGTRRRFSYDNQKEVVHQMSNKILNYNFVGTSNVHLAHLFNIKPIGTHAHEWFMFHAAKYGYKMANHLGMENWSDVFRGNLGIALPDTFTTDVFLRSFDTKFAKLYDGVRQDSGDPKAFTDKTIEHYKKLDIDPMTKTIIFSDSLNAEKAVELKDYCKGKIKSSFGIGTNFSNDVGVTPLNIVIKMTEAKPEGEEWHPCIKLGDGVGKETGIKKEIEMAQHILNI